jgi:hypothetical protein
VYSELLVATQAAFWAGLLPSSAGALKHWTWSYLSQYAMRLSIRSTTPAWFARNNPHVKAPLVLSFALASLLSGVPGFEEF